MARFDTVGGGGRGMGGIYPGMNFGNFFSSGFENLITLSVILRHLI
jgi:hypothetical protein